MVVFPRPLMPPTIRRKHSVSLAGLSQISVKGKYLPLCIIRPGASLSVTPEPTRVQTASQFRQLRLVPSSKAGCAIALPECPDRA